MGIPVGEEHEGLLRRRLGLDAWEPLPGSMLTMDGQRERVRVIWGEVSKE
jgi:hypothetical protein